MAGDEITGKKKHGGNSVKNVYSITRKRTRKGGNCSGGEIYGETTVGSFERLVELLKNHTQFTHESRFLDVGSSLGKPSARAHNAQEVRVKMHPDSIPHQHAAANPNAVVKYQVQVPLQGWVDDGFGIVDDYESVLPSFVNLIQESIGAELQQMGLLKLPFLDKSVVTEANCSD
jgi:hypothetical protein